MKMLFTLPKKKDGTTGEYKFSNNGYVVIVVQDGEIANVRSKRLQSKLIANGIARKATSKDTIRISEEASAVTPEDEDGGLIAEDLSQLNAPADDDDADDDSTEPDDLTVLHKVGEATALELNAMGINSFADMQLALSDPDSRDAIVAIKGITEKDIARLEDQLIALESE